MSKKKKVLLLIQSGYSARNFILSGFLNHSNFDFVFWSDQDYIEQYGIENQFVKLPEYEYNSKVNLLLKIKNRAELYFNVKRTGNKNYLSYLIGIYKNQPLRSRLRNNLISSIAGFYANEKGIENLDKPLYKRIRKTNYYTKCKDQLKKEAPDVVYCTHQRASNALAPMLAARDLGIKTICFIHSWDNIPKGVQLVKADEYFVWSLYMKDEMIEHYPFINENNIKVTGTPQFTYYFEDEYRLERSEFLNQFKLDTEKRYILFSGNDKTTSPNDPVYLSDLCKSVKELNKEEDIYRVLFRPNPIDRNEGFDTVLDEFSDVATEIKPDWFGTDVFLWNKGGPSKKDVSLLINTIIHSDLIVNMGSTMALDAAILGKPSCYINYDVESTFDWSVERTYKFIHFKMIKDIDPVFWINNRKTRLEVLREALTHSESKKEGREQWINRATQLPIKGTIERMWKHLA
ncbi:hypothetical protein [Pseudotenacibaculum haliotis]|uniref:UDP-glycosyltransferase n=1 Tax=Pseudotenacibaculum haliotis TaxID=1862138 RepID=A0ABW5LSN6_9FLAO